MQTLVVRVNPQSPEPEAIARAAEVLRSGELVAFPTETVYGLGANALDAVAVARIFVAKGRPANNPLIVHVADTEQARQMVSQWSEAAARLSARFWPGPLTLVLPKSKSIPDIVTGGGPTVAARIPAHPVALALLRAAGVPLAAPSANRSEHLSPTRAEHVLRGLNGRITMILDAGPTTGGLESTVLNLTTTPPTLLRPGLIPPEEIEAVIGPITRLSESAADEIAPSSPGMRARHYAPRASLEIAAGDGWEQVKAYLEKGLRVGWIGFGETSLRAAPGLEMRVLPEDPAAAASQLYDTLHALDDAGVERIVVAAPPQGETWLAIRDRLRRASVSKP